MAEQRALIWKGRGLVQPWRFRIVGGNNEIVHTSEGYFSRWNAKRAARKLFPNARIVGE